MTNRRVRTGGSSLLITIFFLASLIFGVFILSMVSTQSTLFAGKKHIGQIQAQNAAQTLISQVLTKFEEGDFSYSTDIEVETGISSAFLTFDSESGKPYSTNNLTESASVSGWNNTIVPGNACHLVAVGENNGQKVAFEVMIFLPEFPWAIASNGVIQGNDMEVAGVSYSEYVNTGLRDGSLDDDEVGKSNLLSNAQGSSIVLTGSSRVRGNAQTRGRIQLSGSSQIDGKREENQPERVLTIPKRAAQYAPDPSDTQLFDASVSNINTLFRARNNEVVNRDLAFEEGFLFVEGDLEINGNVSGYGVIVALGDITINGSVSNSEGDLLALVSGRSVELNGSGQDLSFFKGLVLAEGSFKARDITLLGSVVTLDQAGTVELERVRSVSANDITKLDLTYAVKLKEATNANRGLVANEVAVIFYEGSFIELTPTNYDALEALGQLIADNNDSGELKVRVEHSDGTFTIEDRPSATFFQDFRAALDAWTAYEGQVKTNSVEYEEIFQLDFNKFLQAKGGFRHLYQRAITI